jgi:hypothetical protein
MTVRHYGRVMPLQMDMLNLGGEVLSWGGTAPPTDRDRLNVMKEAREMLTQQTGRDFGFDLASWHHFLLNDDKLSEEYTFVYAWDAVKHRIDELIDDPDRLRLVRLLEERPDGAAVMQ